MLRLKGEGPVTAAVDSPSASSVRCTWKRLPTDSKSGACAGAVTASAGLRSLLCSAGEQPTAVGACFAMRPQSQALLTANRPL